MLRSCLDRMKLIVVVLLASFLVVEAAHLNYHRQRERVETVVNGRELAETEGDWRKPVDF